LIFRDNETHVVFWHPDFRKNKSIPVKRLVKVVSVELHPDFTMQEEEQDDCGGGGGVTCRPKVLSNGTTVSHPSRGPNSEVVVVRPPHSEAGRGIRSAATERIRTIQKPETDPDRLFGGDSRSRLSGKSEDVMKKKVVAAKRSSRGGLDVESSGSGRKRYRETRGEHGGGGRAAAPPPPPVPSPPPVVHPQAPRSERSGGDAVEAFEPPPSLPPPPPPPPEGTVHPDWRKGKPPTPTSTPAPRLRTLPWAPYEDRIIIEGYAELGKQWGAIASRLHRSNRRTNLQVYHRWKALVKAETAAETTTTTESVVINKTARAAVAKTTERQSTVSLSREVADRERRLERIRSAREASRSSQITQKEITQKEKEKPEGSSQASEPESRPVVDMPPGPLEEDPGGLLLRLHDDEPSALVRAASFARSARSEGPHFRSAGGHAARYYGTRRAAQHPPHASSTLIPHAKDTDPKDRSCDRRRRCPPPPPQAQEGPPHPPKSHTLLPSKDMSHFVTNVRNVFVSNRGHGESPERALYEGVLDAVCSFYFKEMPRPTMLSCMDDILRGYPDLFDQFLNVVSKELGGIRPCE
jgi:hypothetical protein